VSGHHPTITRAHNWVTVRCDCGWHIHGHGNPSTAWAAHLADTNNPSTPEPTDAAD
jgi:hypothetical protein